MRRTAILLALLVCTLPATGRGQVTVSSPAREGLAEIRADYATLLVPAGPITITAPAAATVRSEPGRVTIEWAVGPTPTPTPTPPGPNPPTPPTPTPTPDPPRPTPQVTGPILVLVSVRYADFGSYPKELWDLRTSATIRGAMANLDASYLFDEANNKGSDPGVYVFDRDRKLVHKGPLPKNEAELVARIKTLRGIAP